MERPREEDGGEDQPRHGKRKQTADEGDEKEEGHEERDEWNHERRNEAESQVRTKDLPSRPLRNVPLPARRDPRKSAAEDDLGDHSSKGKDSQRLDLREKRDLDDGHRPQRRRSCDSHQVCDEVENRWTALHGPYFSLSEAELPACFRRALLGN